MQPLVVQHFSAESYKCVCGVVCRSGSVIVDLSADFSTSLNDTFIINNIMPKILQNLMSLNNSIIIDGVKYSAAVDMIFEREVPRMNGSLISADNVTACMSVFLLMPTQS